MVIQVKGTSLTRNELEGFIEYYDTDRCGKVIDFDKSHFVESEGTDEVVSIVVDDNDLYDVEISDFIDFLTRCLSVGVEVSTVDCDKVKVKARKAKSGFVEMEVE